MPLKRKSYHLSRLLSEVRKYALETDDDDMRSKLWRLYFKAQHAEEEVRAMVMDAEMRRLLDFVFPNGIPSDLVDDAPRNNPTDTDTQPPDDDTPKQRRLWD